MDNDAPSLLVSFVYLESFLQHRHRYDYRSWVLDSGAFSAYQSGVTIELSAFIETCKRLRAIDPKLHEIFALDVIGDWKASLRNCEEMWRQGIEAIPCFHYGEPEHVLKTIARDYPKIALGGCARMMAKSKLAFAGQCFARVWPKQIHGFGFGAEQMIMELPFHSVDATSWEIRPCQFGYWQSFGQTMSVRGSKQNLRSEVEWYLALEIKARKRWAKEMVKLDAVEEAPSIRLALGNSSENNYRYASGLGHRTAEAR